jgi:hypothetical protein
MRNNLIPAAALAMIGFTVPASAADVGYVQEPVTEIYTQAGPLPGGSRYRQQNRAGFRVKHEQMGQPVAGRGL